MTYLEKVIELYRDLPNITESYLMHNKCPDQFFMLPGFKCPSSEAPCHSCWMQEYKGEEVKE